MVFTVVFDLELQLGVHKRADRFPQCSAVVQVGGGVEEPLLTKCETAQDLCALQGEVTLVKWLQGQGSPCAVLSATLLSWLHSSSWPNHRI